MYFLSLLIMSGRKNCCFIDSLASSKYFCICKQMRVQHLHADFSGTSLLPLSPFTLKIGGHLRWHMFQSPKKPLTSDPRARLLCDGISRYCYLCWSCTLECPWASQSTVLYTPLPYPAFPMGTEKERLGGQTPLAWVCRNPPAQARESRGTGWDASAGSGRARFTARLCCQPSRRPYQSGQDGKGIFG